jgi:hypothetical protein
MVTVYLTSGWLKAFRIARASVRVLGLVVFEALVLWLMLTLPVRW